MSRSILHIPSFAVEFLLLQVDPLVATIQVTSTPLRSL